MQNILVVEDDYDLNQAICYSLKKSGYGVYGVTFMEKGKQIFFENQIEMVLLDVNLPDGEGFSFCQWVKKQKEVPVIYLTARDMEEDALTGYESGAEDYVTKPFSMKILLRKIEVILKRTASVWIMHSSIPNQVERSIFRQKDRNYFLKSAFPILEKGLPRRGRQRSLQDFTVSRRFMINQGLGSDYILQEQSWNFRRAT